MAADDTTPTVDSDTSTAPAADGTGTPTQTTHSEFLLRSCDALGISREQAAGMSKADLRELIQDAQLAQSVEVARRQPTPSPPPPPAPDPEPEIPREVEAELEDRPHLKKYLKTVTGQAARGAKAIEEVERLRKQTSSQTLEQRVNAALGAIPVPPGVTRQDRDLTVVQMLGTLEQLGRLNGMTPEQATAAAHKAIYGSAAPAGTSPPPPPPTKTAKPTNTVAAEKGKSRREQLKEIYAEALAKQADQEELSKTDDWVP